MQRYQLFPPLFDRSRSLLHAVHGSVTGVYFLARALSFENLLDAAEITTVNEYARTVYSSATEVIETTEKYDRSRAGRPAE